MDHYRVDLSTPPDWAPLLGLAALCARRACSPRIEVDRFMYMGVARRSGFPDVHMYKSSTTRAYLCLDACGHAYRCTQTGGQLMMCVEDIGTALRRVLERAETLRR